MFSQPPFFCKQNLLFIQPRRRNVSYRFIWEIAAVTHGNARDTTHAQRGNRYGTVTQLTQKESPYTRRYGKKIVTRNPPLTRRHGKITINLSATFQFHNLKKCTNLK